MKKRKELKCILLLSAFIFALLLINFNFVYAQEVENNSSDSSDSDITWGVNTQINPENPNDPLGIGVDPENVPRDSDEWKKVSNDYLKQEWAKILEKNQFGRFILGVGEVFGALNPVFKIILGVEYTLSWYFFLALFLWVFIAVLIYRPLKDIVAANGWIALGIAVIIPTLGAQLGVIKYFADFFTPLLTNKYSLLSSLVILVLVLIAYDYFMRTVGKTFKERAKKDDEARRELKAKTMEKIHDIEFKASGGKF